MKPNFYEKLLNIKDEKRKQQLRYITKLMDESYNSILQKKSEKIITKEVIINIIKDKNKIILNNIINNDKKDDNYNDNNNDNDKEFKHIYLYHNSVSISGKNLINREEKDIILT